MATCTVLPATVFVCSAILFNDFSRFQRLAQYQVTHLSVVLVLNFRIEDPLSIITAVAGLMGLVEQAIQSIITLPKFLCRLSKRPKRDYRALS